MGRNRKKKSFQNVEIIDTADKGYSVGRTPEGEIVLVEKAVPGDVVNVIARRKKKSMWWTTPTEFVSYSEFRQDPFCDHFDQCGGCQWQHLIYEKQSFYKEKRVKDSIERLAKIKDVKFLPILSAEEYKGYRNKMEFSFTEKRWLSLEEISSGVEFENQGGVGLFSAGNHEKATNIFKCHLQNEPSNKIRNFLRDYAIQEGLTMYNTRTHEGFLRQILIRTSELDQCMVVLSVGEDDREKTEVVLQALLDAVPEITSSYFCVNLKHNNFMYDLDMIYYKGTKQIEEQLGHLKFNIGPKSFFQTNTKQGKNLYDVVADFAQLDGSENVYDLYSGTGSIGLYLAQHCTSVVGIEEIEMAVEDAAVNASDNNISNSRFYHGLVRDVLTEEFQKEHGKPDVLITDPPRVGMHPDVIDLLIELKSPKIVYVSCNPATQARDIAMLKEHYELVQIRAVDMFPQTSHIESVALLKLRS